jgi:hypothetical protein
MRQRCENYKNGSFMDYGHRGISVCERWNSFENFLEDMGEKPVGLTIERKDNNGNYDSKNCIWATRKEQTRNRRNRRSLTINNETRSVSDWASLSGIRYGTIIYRLKKGWDAKRAAFDPLLTARHQ